MITKLQIENFKSWLRTGEIKMAPLTVFFGTNSSGKSSLNQFLLLLKQTVQSPDRKVVLHLGDKNSVVDLGTYWNIAPAHDENKELAFTIAWRMRNALVAEDKRNNRRYSSKTITFSSTIKHQGEKVGMVVKDMSYSLGDPSSDGLQIGLNGKNSGAGNGKYDLAATNFSVVRNQGRAWDLPAPVHFHGFPDEVVAYFQNAEFTKDLALSLETMLNHLYYLGPLRDYPQRLYTWSGEVPEHVGWHGERAVDAILAAKNRSVSAGERKRYYGFQEVIAGWLKRMGLIESFEIKPVGKNRREYEVLVKTTGVKERVNLTDVGFGVSQVLPVLVECFYAPFDSTLILEQPEIHLHPSVQSWLADFFIEAIHAREGSQDRNLQLIVESHSEHFLRRLQRRIAEGQIKSSEVAVYFCRNTERGSALEPLEIDLFGNILNWPANFFGDENEDLVKRLEAEMEAEPLEKSN